MHSGQNQKPLLKTFDPGTKKKIPVSGPLGDPGSPKRPLEMKIQPRKSFLGQAKTPEPTPEAPGGQNPGPRGWGIDSLP